ncbi:MAG: outer membrane beta-barrel protein [Bacteroidota bacterium]
MRKFLLATLMLTMVMTLAQAQDDDRLTIPKGTWILGGNVSFFNNTSDTNFSDDFNSNLDRRNFTFSPRIGYAFSDNWTVGLVSEYFLQKGENESVTSNGVVSNGEVKSESLSLAPYVRRYFAINKNLTFFAQGEVGILKSWSENIDFESDRFTSEQDGVFVNLRPGVLFFPAKNLAFETSIGLLGYRALDREDSNGTTAENRDFSFDFNSANLLFGLSYFF